MNSLPLTKGNAKAEARHRHFLFLLTLQMHLDLMGGVIVERPVRKGREIKGPGKFSVNSAEKIEVKGGRHTGGVIVGGFENIELLTQVKPDEKIVARTQHVRELDKKSRLLHTREVADITADK